jgi:hypothetical protein
MSRAIFLEYDCDAIQAAMAVALLKFNNTHPELTYAKIGKVIEREHQSVSTYANGIHEIPSTCWLKLVAKWPELEARLEYELDEAEKAFRAKQRELRLEAPEEERKAA